MNKLCLAPTTHLSRSAAASRLIFVLAHGLYRLISSVMDAEKASMSHAGYLEHEALDVHTQGFSVDADELPKGYLTSRHFVGSFVACGLNLAGSTGGFALVAPVIGSINTAIGPSDSIIWLALVYTTCLAVGLTLVSRLSDLFGHRWFFIGGTLLGMIGAIVAATAHSVPVLIGGETLASPRAPDTRTLSW